MFGLSPRSRSPKSSLGFARVEKDGWFIDIETLEVSERPNWEIRCQISRSKDESTERRCHRFVVPRELSDQIGLSKLAESLRQRRLELAAKRVILRELEEIFAEPEEGLDSVRALVEDDLSP